MKIIQQTKAKIFNVIQLFRIFKADKNQYEKQGTKINQENVSLNRMKKFDHWILIKC
jgi:hypothetical protein